MSAQPQEAHTSGWFTEMPVTRTSHPISKGSCTLKSIKSAEGQRPSREEAPQLGGTSYSFSQHA
jgi:hypothetical protein